MEPKTSGLGRRTFLKSGMAAGVAAVGSGVEAAAPEKKDIESDLAIPHKMFGKTGHKLPILGFGGAPITVIFSRAYGVDLLPTDKRVELVRHGYDSGIRYFDTARVYGESESILGKGLKGVRQNVYLATKCHGTRPEDVRKMVETSLKQLDTDYLDVVQIHSPAIESVGFDGTMKLHAELVKLRDEKMLRFIGLTTHVAFETVLSLIETDAFDQVLLAYGYFRKGMMTILSNANVELREQCLAAAHERGMGIVAMKVLGANILNHNAAKVVPGYDAAELKALPAAAIRWTLKDERVQMLNIGVAMKSDIDTNIGILKGDLKYTNADSRTLARFSRAAYESETCKKMAVT